jgi:hypothetical protein
MFGVSNFPDAYSAAKSTRDTALTAELPTAGIIRNPIVFDNTDIR